GRDHVLRDPALDAHHAQHLAVDEPVELDLERLQASEWRETLREQVYRVTPRPRPCRVCALAVELDPGLQVAEAARVEDRVRRLEHDGKLGTCEHAARENGGERALLERD